MKQSVTLLRKISVLGYTATLKIKFISYSGGFHWYAWVWETSKAIKAIAQSANLPVIWCISKTYAWGDSVTLTTESLLSPEQKEKNKQCLDRHYPEYTKEPNQEILDQICDQFAQGRLDSTDDTYTYWKSRILIEWPNGDPVELWAKYCFHKFITK